MLDLPLSRRPCSARKVRGVAEDIGLYGIQAAIGA